MKKLFTLTLLTLLLWSPIFQIAAEASDVDGHQMETELNYWINKGVIKADTKGKYNPNKAVTRGEFASYIAHALELPTSTKFKFKDLTANTGLTTDIQNAAGAGILSGYPDGTFRAERKNHAPAHGGYDVQSDALYESARTEVRFQIQRFEENFGELCKSGRGRAQIEYHPRRSP